MTIPSPPDINLYNHALASGSRLKTIGSADSFQGLSFLSKTQIPSEIPPRFLTIEFRKKVESGLDIKVMVMSEEEGLTL